MNGACECHCVFSGVVLWEDGGDINAERGGVVEL